MSLTPVQRVIRGGNGKEIDSVQARDWIAVMAMQGIISAMSDPEEIRSPGLQEAVAKAAYEVADLMVAESQKPTAGE